MQQKTYLQAVVLCKKSDKDFFYEQLEDTKINGVWEEDGAEKEDGEETPPHPSLSKEEYCRIKIFWLADSPFYQSFFSDPQKLEWLTRQKKWENEPEIQKIFATKFSGCAVKLQSFSLAEPENWLKDWKKGLDPIEVGEKFYLCPAWAKPNPSKINLVIEPGQAFGTGYHATTQLMLKMLEAIPNPQFENATALDLGTGSGILVIALSKLGWKKIVAVEKEENCQEEFWKNLALSHVKKDGIQLMITEQFPTPPSSSLAFPLVLANLTTDVLLSYPNWGGICQKKGFLLLSGIFDGESASIESAFKKDFALNMHLTQTDEKAKPWHGLIWEKK